MPAFARRPARLAVLALVLGLIGAVLVIGSGGPATAAAKGTEIDGTAAFKWEPANVTIKPGGSVTFTIKGGPPHPVGSGATPPTDDKAFDTSKCQLAQMSSVGASCTVTFPKAGTFPFFCSVHYSLGMKGVITVGSGGGKSTGGATTTSGAPASTAVAITAPPVATTNPPGHPSIFYAGWGLAALGVFLAAAAVLGYVRFGPSWRRER